MDPAQACPRCGAARLANAPAGLCPRCLLRHGLRAGPAGPGADAASRRSRGAARPWPMRARPGPRASSRPWTRRSGRSPACCSATTLGRGEARPGLLRGDARLGGRRGALPAPRRDRPRGHGRRAQGPRRRPRPRRGRQGPAGAAPRQPRDGPPVRRGGADRRPAPAPGHRPGLRAGPAARRPAVHRHEADPGPHPGRPARGPGGRGRGPAAVSGDLRAGLPGDGLRPRLRRDPPRPEAVERHGRQLRRGPGHGLGARQGDRPGGRRRRGAVAAEPGGDPDPVRTLRTGSSADESRAGSVLGHPLVHGARAGPGPARHARRAGGRLRPRRDPLRDPHRPAALHGAERRRGLPQGGAGGPGRGPGPARRLRRRGRAGRAGEVLPGRGAAGPAAGRGRGRRRPDRLPGRRAGAAPGGRAGPGPGRVPRRRGARSAASWWPAWPRRCSPWRPWAAAAGSG